MNLKTIKIFFTFSFFGIFLCYTYCIWAQEEGALELIDEADIKILEEVDNKFKNNTEGLDLSDIEDVDDLGALKDDLEDTFLNSKGVGSKGGEKGGDEDDFSDLDFGPEKSELIEREANSGNVINRKTGVSKNKKIKIFDVGDEEKLLLEVSRYIEGKIPSSEWNDIAADSIEDKYVVQEGDWLWKISKKLFGTGFYYSKIWSLNPQIKNPHEIVPGMVLVFNTGTLDRLPDVAVGSFDNDLEVFSEKIKSGGKTEIVQHFFKLDEFGEGVKPPWLRERDLLKKKGLFFQYASEETYEDLAILAKQALNSEYQKYEPPITSVIIQEPGEQYDASGFDRDSKITFDFKQGYYLNTFGSTNIVQDLGYIDATEHEGLFIHKYQTVYIVLDSTVKAKAGDRFSVYAAEGNLEHSLSDRSGFRYTILAQLRLIRSINNKWEAEIFDIAGLVQRNDRITIYTPKINKIVQTFNKRNIEAAIVDSYRPTAGAVSYGDVVYLDRGRADGAELGTVFEVYSFIDRGTGRKITPDPTYKIGELTIITLTDDFSTALITNSSDIIKVGALAISKTAEDAARADRHSGKGLLAGVGKIENLALDELDVELNLDDLGDDLLKKADQIKLSEDELEELERQERDKSIIKDHEKDLRELERLEAEIVNAEALLNESKLDEDRFLEQHNLNNLEKQGKVADINAFKSLDEIEKDVGKKYMDQDLNALENPYGLTEFDLEEVDQLLNTDSK